MKLLNPGYDNNQEETFECSYDSTLQKTVCTSKGTKNVNNSLYWNKSSGTCISGTYNSEKTCDFTTIGLDTTAKSMIDTVVWNTGALPYDNSSYTGLNLYTAERGNKTTKSSTYSSATQGIDDTVERTTTWTGKVGLLYASDYILASGDFYSGSTLAMTRSQCIGSTSYTSCTYSGNNSNWLSKDTMPVTLLNPVYGQNSSGSDAPLSYVAYAITSISSMPAIATNYVTRPVVYLDPKVKVKSGDGSQGDPFVFEMGESKNTAKNYGLISESSEEDDDSFVEETETDDYEKLVVDGRRVVGFDYDSETSTFTNQNKGVIDAIAISYTIFDLTNSDVDKKLNISYTLSRSSTYGAYAYINLLKDEYHTINYNDSNSYSGYNDDNNTNIGGQLSQNVDNKQLETIILEKGHKYYLQFAYDKKNSDPVSSSNKDEFSIKVVYEEPTEEKSAYTRYDGITPVLNQEPDTVEMLRDISLTTALTNEDTRDMILDLNGHTLTTSQSTYTITNNGSLKVIDSKYNEEIEDVTEEHEALMLKYNNEVTAANASYQAEFDALSESDYATDNMTLNLSAKNHGTEEGKWKDLTDNNHDFTINNATFNDEGALVFDDKDDYLVGDVPISDNSTFEMTFYLEDNLEEMANIVSSVKKGYTISTPACSYSSISSGSSCYMGIYVTNSTRKMYNNYTSSNGTLRYGQLNTIQIIMNSATTSTIYVNGDKYSTSTYTSGNYSETISRLVFGRSSETDDSTFKGKIYSIRLYDRNLTYEESHKNYEIDQKTYGGATNSKEYDSYTLPADTLFYQLKEYNGSTISTTTTAAYSAYGTYLTLNQNSTGNNNNVALISEPIDFGTSFSYFTTTASYYVRSASYPATMYVGLTKEQNFTSIDDFDVYEEFEMNSTSTQSKKITLKPTEKGKYRLKIVFVRPTYSARPYCEFKDLTVNKGEPVDLETAINTQLTQTGAINSTTYSTILNNEGANLEIQEGIVNLKKAGSFYGIINKGNLTLGKRASVDASSYSSGVGILNDITGDILDGEGTIKGYTYSLHNKSSIDTEIKGYTFKVSPINNQSANQLKLKNVLITDYGTGNAIEDNTTRKLTIEDSKIVATQTPTTSKTAILRTKTNGGIIEINNSELIPYSTSYYIISQGTDTATASWSRDTSSASKNYIINDCNLKGVLFSNTGSSTVEINDSTVSLIRSVSGTLNINNSTVTGTTYKYMDDATISNSTLKNNIYIGDSVDPNATVNIINNSNVSSIINYKTVNIKNSDFYSLSNYLYTRYRYSTSSSYSYSYYTGTANITDSTGGSISNSGVLKINGITMHAVGGGTAISNTLSKYTNGTGWSARTWTPSCQIAGTVDIKGYYIGISATGDQPLTVGTNDEEVSSTDIKITASNTGISSTAPFNWYDGSITAPIENSIDSKINSFPEGYDIEITESGTLETATLEPVDEGDYVAQIGNEKYKSLQAAFDAVPEDGTETEIMLLKRLVTVQTSELDEGKNAKINFNDQKMKYHNGSIVNNGTLKLFDETEEVTKDNYSYVGTLITNNGTLDYNDIRFKSTSIENTGTLTINSGYMYATSASSGVQSYPYVAIINTKDLVLNGGELSLANILSSVESSTTTINNITMSNAQVSNYGTLNVLGGTYTNSSSMTAPIFRTWAGSTNTITDGNFNSSVYAIINNGGTTTIEGIESSSKTIGTTSGILTLKNNTFDSLNTSPGLATSGTTKFESGSYNSTAQLIDSTAGKLTIDGTEFTSTGAGISSSGGAELLIEDIDLDTTGNGITINSSGDTTVLHGTIKSKDRGISNLVNGTGTITIGQKGFNDEEETELVSVTDPEISGTNYGFANGREATVVNFYDGIIKGTNPINSNINDVEEGYEVVGNQDNTQKWLGRLPVIRNVDQNKDYFDIQQAINEAQDSETLQFLREVTGLTTTPTYTVSSEKNITIDLNGFKIIQNNEKFLDNAGTLTLTNSKYNLTISDDYQITQENIEGFLYNTGRDQMITNTGTLTLDKIMITDATEGNVITNTGGTLEITKSSIEDLVSGRGIINTGGTLTIDTALISAADSTTNNTVGENIYNDGGEVTINNVIISSKKGTSISNIGTDASMTITKAKIASTSGTNIENAGTLTYTNGITTVSSGTTIINSGTATIDNVSMKSTENNKMVDNTSKLTIKNSTITETTYINGYYAYNVSNSLITSTDELTILDTDITRGNDYYYRSGYNYVFDYGERNGANLIYSNGNKLTIKGGTSSFTGGAFVDISGTTTTEVDIEDVTYSGYGGIYLCNNKTTVIPATLKDLTLSTTSYSLYVGSDYFSNGRRYVSDPETNPDTSKFNVDITGGTYTTNGTYYNTSGTSYNSQTMMIGGSSTINIIGATINRPTRSSNGMDAIRTYNNTINVNSGKVGYKINATKSTLNIKGGEVGGLYSLDGSNSTQVSTANVTGGKINGDIYFDGNLTLGTKGDLDENDELNVSTETPEVVGTVAWPKNFKFYDGIVKGSLNKNVDDIEDGYNIKNTSNNYHYLTKDPFIKNTTTNAEYNNIKTAIREVQDGETLQIIDNQDVYQNDGEAATIPSTSTVTLDLNGKRLIIKGDTFTNEGTLKITGYENTQVINDRGGSLEATNPIVNEGIINLQYGEISINNNATLNVTGGTLAGSTNSSTGTITLTSGTILSATNSGIIEVRGGTANNITNNSTGRVRLYEGTIGSFTNAGTINMNGGTLGTTSPGSSSSSEGISATGNLKNNGTLTITGGTLISTITNSKTVNISNATINTGAYAIFDSTAGTITASNLTGSAQSIGRITASTLYLSDSDLTLSGMGILIKSLSSGNTAYVKFTNGTYNVKGNFATIFSWSTLSNRSSRMDLNGPTVTATGIVLQNQLQCAGGIVNINSGTYTSTTARVIAPTTDSITVNIGKKDANVSTTSPVLQGSDYAVYQTYGKINFYDGKLIGNSAPVYGRINEYEPGYKLSISHPDETYIGTLTPIGDDERVAVLNGINFTDLQQAINAARDNEEQNIVLYANITLNDNIVVPATKIINVYLNGYTINRGDYTITNNGTFELKEGTPSSLGANIVESIKNALNISDRTKNVIIYEMEDGSQLSAENVYTLYKKANSEYQLMTMERGEEIGRYVIGRGQSEMTTVRGRLYIENLTSGEYKVKDNKGKEISFTIDDDLKVTGNVIENNRPSTNENLVSTAIAELIIAIQTGITRINYLVLITIMLGIIGVLYLINRKKGFE